MNTEVPIRCPSCGAACIAGNTCPYCGTTSQGHVHSEDDRIDAILFSTAEEIVNVLKQKYIKTELQWEPAVSRRGWDPIVLFLLSVNNPTSVANKQHTLSLRWEKLNRIVSEIDTEFVCSFYPFLSFDQPIKFVELTTAVGQLLDQELDAIQSADAIQC